MQDVHTEHCCAIHGCKYAASLIDCTVLAGTPQSHPCETCLEEGYWIEKYPDEPGFFWVTLNWGEVSTVELAEVRRISNGIMVSGTGSFLFRDDILAVWSKPVLPPEIYKTA